MMREAGIQLRGYVKQRFSHFFFTYQSDCELSEERAKVMSKQEDWLEIIRDLKKENERLEIYLPKAEISLSKTASTDPEKVRHDQVTVRAYLSL